MKIEEHRTLVNSLLEKASAEEQASMSEILTQLIDDYAEISNNYEQSVNRVNELTANNEVLRDVNSKLFLRVGQKDESVHKEQITDEIPSMEFSDLFNDKGELK